MSLKDMAAAVEIGCRDVSEFAERNDVSAIGVSGVYRAVSFFEILTR